MSKRKSKSNFSENDKSRWSNKYIGSEVFRNSSAVCDENDPHQSLKYLIEIFSGKLDEDVISMIFSECAYNVDQSLETLMSLSSDVKDTHSTKDFNQHTEISHQEHSEISQQAINQHSEVSKQVLNQQSEVSQQESQQSLEEVSKIVKGVNFSPSDQRHSGVGSSANAKCSANANFNSLSFFSSNQSLLAKSDSQSIISSPSPSLYAGIFPPSNLLTLSNSTTTSKNWSQGSPHKFNSTAPEFYPKLPSKNPPSNRNHKKCKDAKSSPSRCQSKGNKKESSVEDLKWEDGSNQIRHARDLIKNGHLVLIILRGLPGSGKSTLARNLKYSGVVLSTDDYFARNGEYYFDPRYLQEAHAWNQNRTMKALSQSLSPIIIDNTNTEAWEMAPYVSMGKKYNFNIVILEPPTAWKFKPYQLARKNQHGVSKDKIIRMLERYQHNITVESFAESTNLSTPNHNGKPVSLPNSLNSGTIVDTEKCSKQSLSLEAMVHQEEKSYDSLLEKDPKHSNDSTTTSKSDVENEFPSCISIKCQKCSEKAESLENMASATKTKTFDSLDELKSLVQNDTEDTSSLCKDCYRLQTTADESSSWEEVTEHDKDFHWKIPLQECSSNSSLNSVQLQSDVSSSVISDDNLSKNSSENELLQTSVFQNDLIKLSEENDDVSLLSDTINIKESVLQTTDTSRETIFLQSYKSDALPENKTDLKSNLLAHANSASGGIYINALPFFEKNPEKNELNLKLFQNSNFQTNFGNNILSQSENVHAKKFDTVSATRLKPSQRKPSRSFDESLVFRENKTKEVDKNVETNLLRSKFSSVPLFAHEADDVDTANTVVDPSTKFVEKQTDDLIANLRSCKKQQLASPATRLWISDDIGEIIPWVNSESQNVNSTLNTTRNNLLTWDKDCNHNFIDSKFTFPDLVKPKPQRNNLKISVSSTNSYSENKDSLAFLSLNDDSKKDAASDWDDLSEIKKSNFDTAKEPLLKPKPRRNISECTSINRITGFSLATKSEEKDGQASSLSNSSFKTPNNKFCSRKRSPLLKNVEKYMNCDWSLPQFTPNLYDAIVNSEDSTISTSTAETQTEPSDFVQMYKMDTCSNMSNYRIVTPSMNTLKNCEVNNSRDFHEVVSHVVKFEKSTSTEDLVANVEVSEKMDTLRECFPDISEDDLGHLLNLCHEDEAWMINLLLDSGYKYNNPNPEQVVPNSFLRNSLKLDRVSLKTQKTEIDDNAEIEKETKDEVSLPKNICNVSENSETIIQNLESQTNLEITDYIPGPSTFEKMHFTLDPAFAIQLEELFGPVVPTGSSNSSERTVEIDFEFAKLIYDKWKNTVQSPLKNISDTAKKVKKNKNLPLNRLNKQQIKTSSSQSSNEPTSFSEIMDMEYALQIHKNQKLKKDTDCATKLKRIELYNMFPGADPIALDEIFESNNYSLQNSVLALGEDIGEPSSIVKEKRSHKVDECNKLKILRDFENDDWSDWISKEINIESGNEVLQSTIPEEADELRKEATEHYLLRQEFVQKAQNASSRGMKDAAAFYSEKGREHGLKFKESNKAASEIILQQRNASLQSQFLDVHGLFVQEAIPCVEEFLKAKLQRKLQNGMTTVFIITGQGNHSAQGPKLRTSVMEFLRKAGYRFAEVNRGVLEVYLFSE